MPNLTFRFEGKPGSSSRKTSRNSLTVRTIIRKGFKAALDENDILISPAAPSAAYKIGMLVELLEKKNDPSAMYAGDIMTVNVNLAGLPALVLPCGFVEGGAVGLPVGLPGAAFDEEKLVKVGHIFEQTLEGYNFVPPLITDVGGASPEL
uniref:Amidase domain-containing protein n=1 Tax=Gossypium raimondii TaxID=29730 RepID=A0A0D2VLD6_GOSRA|nr:hypothetical protein B456_N005800 [Gossypium raimondii]